MKEELKIDTFIWQPLYFSTTQELIHLLGMRPVFARFQAAAIEKGAIGIRAQAREIINTYNDSLQILQSISERWRSSTKIYLLSNRNFFSSSSSEK